MAHQFTIKNAARKFALDLENRNLVKTITSPSLLNNNNNNNNNRSEGDLHSCEVT